MFLHLQFTVDVVAMTLHRFDRYLEVGRDLFLLVAVLDTPENLALLFGEWLTQTGIPSNCSQICVL